MPKKDPRRLYFVWEDDTETGGWFSQFDTLEDAAGSKGGFPVEVFTAKLRPIGKFRYVRKTMRVKRHSAKRR